MTFRPKKSSAKIKKIMINHKKNYTENSHFSVKDGFVVLWSVVDCLFDPQKNMLQNWLYFLFCIKLGHWVGSSGANTMEVNDNSLCKICHEFVGSISQELEISSVDDLCTKMS